MTEALLHYIWRNRLYKTGEYKTINGERIVILHPGFTHNDAGPDFKQAIVKIGEITWAGDIELHLKTSDWNRHNHSTDKKYDHIILHVVFEHDNEIWTESGRKPIIFELKPWILPETITRYEELQNVGRSLSCAQGTERISPELFNSVLTRAGMERLRRREKIITESLIQCQQNWQETFFRHILICYGFKTNATAFELLGRSLPWKHFQNHLNNQLQTYALIFGQAGLLNDKYRDSYIMALNDEFTYLQKKYRLNPISKSSWNLLRLRPQNFPGMRLAQASELFHQNPQIFRSIFNFTNQDSLVSLFRTTPHNYWQTHYMPDIPSDKHSAIMGDNMINLLIINGVIPFFYSYGRFMGNIDLQERAFHLLELLPPEKNKSTTLYRKYGFPINNSMHSQGVLELMQYYCQKRRCLDCGIGQSLLCK